MAKSNLLEDIRTLVAAASAQRADDGIAATVRALAPADRGPENSGQENAAAALVNELAALRTQVAELRAVGATQIDSIDRNTQATAENTAARSQSAAGTAGRIADTVRRSTGIGLSAAPLIGGLIRLFTRPRSSEPPVLPSFEAPPPVQIEAALPVAGDGGFAPVRRDLTGLPVRVPSSLPHGGTPVTIQVNAIDSRSFLDHSDEIARAVRQAVLQAQGLNGVFVEQ